jgi:hypothetical protein
MADQRKIGLFSHFISFKKNILFLQHLADLDQKLAYPDKNPQKYSAKSWAECAAMMYLNDKQVKLVYLK